MTDDRNREQRLRQRLQAELEQIPLRVDADALRDRLADRASRVPWWRRIAVLAVIPTVVAVVAIVALLARAPGPNIGAPTPSPIGSSNTLTILTPKEGDQISLSRPLEVSGAGAVPGAVLVAELTTAGSEPLQLSASMLTADAQGNFTGPVLLYPPSANTPAVLSVTYPGGASTEVRVDLHQGGSAISVWRPDSGAFVSAGGLITGGALPGVTAVDAHFAGNAAPQITAHAALSPSESTWAPGYQDFSVRIPDGVEPGQVNVYLEWHTPNASGTTDVLVTILGADVTMDDVARCPVTMPSQAPAEIGGSLFGAANAVGSDGLWVGGLGLDGVMIAPDSQIDPNGFVTWKLGWWREVPGDLTITGRRLDAEAPPLQSDVPQGYGSIGFQVSGETFPTEGCWEVTGHVGTASLTFVTFVIKAGS